MNVTTYTVSGMTSSEAVRQVKDKLATVPGIGAVAVELVPDGDSKLFIKHKEDTELDRSAVADAIERAGKYTLT